MQELRLVAVSEDGTYLVLATAGRGTRFTLPVDDRLRAAVRGNFSRLGQYEIEVESPLRPKEIQARIRAGETAEEIAATAGIPVERVRWFEGPVLQEREYVAQQAQRVAVRLPGETTPRPTLGELVAERLTRRGVPADEIDWDSCKRDDNLWRIKLGFVWNGHTRHAEWLFDPRRRHITPHDDEAMRLSAPEYVDPPVGDTTVRPFVPRLASKLAPVPSHDFPPVRHEPPPRYEPEPAAPYAEPPPVRTMPVPPAAYADLVYEQVGEEPVTVLQEPVVHALPAPPEPVAPQPVAYEPVAPEELADEPDQVAIAEEAVVVVEEVPVAESPELPEVISEETAEESAPVRDEVVTPKPEPQPEPEPAPKAVAPAPVAPPPTPTAPKPAPSVPAPAPPAAPVPAASVPAAPVPAVPPAPAASVPAASVQKPPVPKPALPKAPVPKPMPPRPGPPPRAAGAKPTANGARPSVAAAIMGGDTPPVPPAPAKKPVPPVEEPVAVPAARVSEEIPAEPTPAEPKAAKPGKPEPPAPAVPPKPAPPRRKARGRRASVPSWDEIMFGARKPD
ncbi:septation protein SepH [Acrocarpospora catenulata]|uniref:septation protein SepH n=1 Tax=Acrocarpospora catenulata TaxID=2836182 RepID=UPI002023B348|nr:septation protein SepH [Acrocarpospora catenulata]